MKDKNMKYLLTLLTLGLFAAAAVAADKPDTRLFEMRIYYAKPGKLDALNARFRDHTLKLFEKHGMTNVTYWILADDQKGAKNSYAAGNTLIYLLTHRSEAAAKASFDAFRADPVWIAAKEASEKKAGGSLTIPQPNGVKSEFLVPTDYSPVK